MTSMNSNINTPTTPQNSDPKLNYDGEPESKIQRFGNNFNQLEVMLSPNGNLNEPSQHNR